MTTYASYMPIELNSFRVAMVDSVPDDLSLSANIGTMLMTAHKPRNGRAEKTPF